jgi:Protein of unknown function (DUF1549)/Protein of unknown function (DUF1553)
MKWVLNMVCPLRHVSALLAAILFVAVLIVPPGDVAWGQTETKETKESSARKAGPSIAPGAAAPSYGIQQVQRINEETRRVWTDNQIVPSPPAPDIEWCRRVYLDVIGRIPSVDELRAFVASRDADRKAKLVNKLLTDDAYIDEYARNWTTIWTNILIGRNGGLDNNTMINREGMQKYLRDSFARNKPYDRMVYELVTATGATAPGTEDYNGATNFLVMKLDDNAAQATAMTAKIFLGLQVQCTQCHNHPFNDWKQQKFWEFNAFFRQTRAARLGMRREMGNAKLMNQDTAGENNSPKEAIIFYEERNGQLRSAYPVFVDGTEIGRSGYLSECDRRTELGKLIVNSPYMDKALANRMWQHFLGYGFTKPVDDLGPHNNPSHPALLEYLGEQFRYVSHDIKELIKWITLSEAYSLSSRITKGNQKDDPLLGEQPKFSHFYLRQMRAEELYESLLVATEAHKTRGTYEEVEKQKADWLRQFTLAFGTDEGDEATTFNGTIPQALMLFNGDLIKKATDVSNGSFLHRVAASNLKPEAKIDYLFNAALSRDPSKAEIGIANQLLVARKGDAAAALQDIFWAVLNSNEFIIQH